MQITTYKCDVCGAEIQGARKSILIASIDERGNITESNSLGIDACPGCAKQLSDRLVITDPTENRPAKEEDPKEEKKDPEPQVKPKIGRRALDFDLGKAVLLKRGGWPLSKIADEMGCSPQTVANYLERAGIIKKKENVNASNTADVSKP